MSSVEPATLIIGFLCLVNAALIWLLWAITSKFLTEIQLLLNKLMSRSYSEFRSAEVIEPRPEFKVEPDIPEDMRSLQEFSV